jgi:hypothetical protein
MTYPPGSPGYPPAQQQPTQQFAAPTQQFGKVSEPAPTATEGPSSLPVYLSIAVAVLGLAVYLSNFAPIFTVSSSDFPINVSVTGSTPGVGLAVAASVLAALLAGISLLPKQKHLAAVVAAIAVLAFLLVVAELFNKVEPLEVGWGLYLLITFTFLQAAAAVAVVLFDAGVITPPAPRPKYEQQYGQYGAPYYGPPQHGGPPQQGPAQQRPGYPSPYGGYPGSGPSTGGFAGGPQGGPPTPPTGFPTYGQPPSSSAPTAAVPAQPQSSSSSNQSAPPPS